MRKRFVQIARTVILIFVLLLAAAGAVLLFIVGKSAVHSSSAHAPQQEPRMQRVMPNSLPERYLELMKLYLTRYDFGDETVAVENGTMWPKTAETMIGLKRLDSLHANIKDVIARHVPGDFIEAGAWRGGATIFMRAALWAYDEPERRVWVADSFEGLPKPDASRYPVDAGEGLWKFSQLAVSLEEVTANFKRYGLLDDRVRFLKGWFKDTLPVAPIERLAIVRVDGDMYESTIEALQYLYPKLTPGGYLIVDDYGQLGTCRQAVVDFRHKQGITSPITKIDYTGIYWIK